MHISAIELGGHFEHEGRVYCLVYYADPDPYPCCDYRAYDIESGELVFGIDDWRECEPVELVDEEEFEQPAEDEDPYGLFGEPTG